MKKILALFLLSPIVFASNTNNDNLDFHLGGYDYPFSTDRKIPVRLTCEEFVQWRSEKWQTYSLYENGFPECQSEEVPDAWVESKKSINSFKVIKCDIPCTVYRMPLKGNESGQYLGHIRSTQEIYIKDEIKTIENAGSAEIMHPWYREWYSFEYKGDIYYTTKANVIG